MEDVGARPLSSGPLSDRTALASVTSDSIRSKEFSVVLRGFSPAEVRQYLARVAQWFDGLKLEIIQLAAQPHTPQKLESGDGDLYGDLGARMAEVLRSVDQYAQQLRREVEEEGGRRAAEAHHQAEQVELDARARAESILREANQAVKELADRRALLLTELHGLLGLMGNIAGQLQRDLVKVEGSGAAETTDQPGSKEEVTDTRQEYVSADYGRS